MSSAAPQSVRPVRKSEIFAWTLYDWSNSSYSTLMITIVVVYLTTVVMPGKAGALMYGWGIGVTMFVAALFSPVIGAIADSRANKSSWFRWTTIPGSLAAAALGLASPDHAWLFCGLFLISNIGYELSWGIYNAFLPEIADQTTMNRVSSFGFAMGYIGGGLALAVAIMILLFGDKLGLPAAGDLERDYVRGKQIDFAVELPPGQYQVKVTLGDILGPHDALDVSLQGDKVATIATKQREFVVREFPVEIGPPIAGDAGPKLTAAKIDPARLLLVQVASADPAQPAILNGVEISGASLAAPLVFDFGSPASPAAEGSYWVTEEIDQDDAPGDRWGLKDEAWLLKHHKKLKAELEADAKEPSKTGVATALAGALTQPTHLGLDPLGVATGEHDLGGRDSVIIPRLQVCLILMGVWWTVFSLPALFLLRDRSQPSVAPAPLGKTAVQAFEQVGRTLRSVRKYKMLFLFMIAFLIYNDGVQTIITQASIFAQEVLHIGAGDLVMVVLMIQFVSMPGALFMGWLANKLGEKPTLLLCIGIYIAWLFASFFITTVAQFWVMGAALALVMGGIQSVSRAIMGQMTPPSRSGEFFGFFNLSGKATSFAGPIVFSSILAWSGKPHLAIFSLLPFFLVGGGLAWWIDMQAGRRQAELEG